MRVVYIEDSPTRLNLFRHIAEPYTTLVPPMDLAFIDPIRGGDRAADEISAVCRALDTPDGLLLYLDLDLGQLHAADLSQLTNLDFTFQQCFQHCAQNLMPNYQNVAISFAFCRYRYLKQPEAPTQVVILSGTDVETDFGHLFAIMADAFVGGNQIPVIHPNRPFVLSRGQPYAGESGYLKRQLERHVNGFAELFPVKTPTQLDLQGWNAMRRRLFLASCCEGSIKNCVGNGVVRHPYWARHLNSGHSSDPEITRHSAALCRAVQAVIWQADNVGLSTQSQSNLNWAITEDGRALVPWPAVVRFDGDRGGHDFLALVDAVQVRVNAIPRESLEFKFSYVEARTDSNNEGDYRLLRCLWFNAPAMLEALVRLAFGLADLADERGGSKAKFECTLDILHTPPSAHLAIQQSIDGVPHELPSVDGARGKPKQSYNELTRVGFQLQIAAGRLDATVRAIKTSAYDFNDEYHYMEAQ